MKVFKLVAENIKKIKAISIEAGDRAVLKITGANEQGKTTILDCITWALAGTKNIQQQPIRTGENKGRIQLDLGDMVVTRSFTEKGSYLEVTNKDGAFFKSPQTLLDNLIGRFSFDPLKFAKADNKEQINTLLSLVEINLDYDKVEEITGTKTPENSNPLEVLKYAYKRIFDSRTDINREVAKLQKTLEHFKNVEEVQPVSIAELLDERRQFEAHNAENISKRNELEDKKSLYQKKLFETEKQELKIERLKRELEEAEKTLLQMNDELKSERADLEVMNNSVSLLEDRDLGEVDKKIEDAENVNNLSRKWSEKVEMKEALKELILSSDLLSSKLGAIIEYKENLLSSAKFPIDGLSFNTEGVIYNNVPFDQASSAQKLQISLAVAMALNPTLRVIRIDDGSLLDSKHMAVIEEMAKEKDYQIWMECVDESGKVGVYIEDGEVKENADRKEIEQCQ